MALEFNFLTFSFLQSSVFNRYIVRTDGGPIDQFTSKKLHFKMKTDMCGELDTVEPPLATTSLERPLFQNTKIFPVKSLYM